MIAEERIQEIKKDFDKVIIYSQNIEEPKTDKLFETWLKNKANFIEIFGDLIYEYPEKISFELSPEAKHERVINFVDEVYNNWRYSDLSDFIAEQEEGFFSNITIKDYTAPNGKTITKGTKLVKAFKYFVENEMPLTYLQNKASQIIQENKIEGRLCLSVHPLDFLSISETTHNWRSCHSLDGEYRAGNLSYMMDSSTFICYLKSDNDVKLPNFPEEIPWNSKKWRVLMFRSNDKNMFFAGKQYPFSTASGMNILLEKIFAEVKLISNDSLFYKWSEWNETIYPTVNISKDNSLELRMFFVPYNNGFIKINNMIKDKKGSKHFNDLLYSSTYIPQYIVKFYTPTFGDPEMLINEKTKFGIGEFTYCLHCGEKEIFSGAETMRCESCELEFGSEDNDTFSVCDCCGNRTYREDMLYVDGDLICENCYDNYACSCEDCGDSFYSDNMNYDEDTDQWLCTYCYNQLMEERKEDMLYGAR